MDLVDKVKLLDIDWSAHCYHETTYFKDVTAWLSYNLLPNTTRLITLASDFLRLTMRVRGGRRRRRLGKANYPISEIFPELYQTQWKPLHCIKQWLMLKLKTGLTMTWVRWVGIFYFLYFYHYDVSQSLHWTSLSLQSEQPFVSCTSACDGQTTYRESQHKHLYFTQHWPLPLPPSPPLMVQV